MKAQNAKEKRMKKKFSLNRYVWRAGHFIAKRRYPSNRVSMETEESWQEEPKRGYDSHVSTWHTILLSRHL
jgi:hypothetical protein